MTRVDRTGLVLAGGRSTRFAGALRDVVRDIDPAGVAVPPADVSDVDTLSDLLALEPRDDRPATDSLTMTDDTPTTQTTRPQTDATRCGGDRR